jgi:hypothetical protein
MQETFYQRYPGDPVSEKRRPKIRSCVGFMRMIDDGCGAGDFAGSKRNRSIWIGVLWFFGSTRIQMLRMATNDKQNKILNSSNLQLGQGFHSCHSIKRQIPFVEPRNDKCFCRCLEAWPFYFCYFSLSFRLQRNGVERNGETSYRAGISWRDEVAFDKLSPPPPRRTGLRYRCARRSGRNDKCFALTSPTVLYTTNDKQNKILNSSNLKIVPDFNPCHSIKRQIPFVPTPHDVRAGYFAGAKRNRSIWIGVLWFFRKHSNPDASHGSA